MSNDEIVQGDEIVREAPVRSRKSYFRDTLSVGHVLSTSFALFFKKFPVYMLLALIISIPVFIVATQLEGNGLILYLTFSKLFMQQLIMAAIVYSVFRHMRKEPAELGRCLAIAVSRFLHLLIVLILIGLFAFMASLIPLIIIMIVAKAVDAGGGLSFLLTCVGFIPGIMILIALYAAPTAVVVERISPVEAIRRSQILTRGNRWRIFGAYLTLAVLQSIVLSVITYIVVSITGTVGPPSGEFFSTSNMLDFIVTFLSSTLMAVASAVIYYQLKMKVDGMDEKELASIFD
jgi:uncharacterized membrane protein